MEDSKELNEIRSELYALQTSQKSKLSKLLILVVSLVIFAILSKIWFSWYGIAIIIIVILIHELGHLIGMRKFGYNDPHMFFIPFFGAAVSGTETHPDGTHKAIISLLGPLPGIIIGVLFGVFYLLFHKFILLGISVIFLFINGLNLLPFYPLDGGQFFDSILFARNRRIEIVFKLLPVFVFSVIAVYFQVWLLGILAFISLISFLSQYKIISVANEVKKSYQPTNHLNNKTIPEDLLNNMLNRLKGRLSFQMKTPKQAARFLHIVWQKIKFEPPNLKASFILFFIYGLSISVVIFIPNIMIAKAYDKKIEIFHREDGETGKRELIFLGDFLVSSYEISDDNLYHGKAKHYILDKVIREGQYSEGKWHGEWTYYDMKGKVIRVLIFDKGHFVTEKKLTRSGWKELKWDDLSERVKRIYTKHEKGMALGPGIKRKYSNP